jgi:hypothetical protein
MPMNFLRVQRSLFRIPSVISVMRLVRLLASIEQYCAGTFPKTYMYSTEPIWLMPKGIRNFIRAIILSKDLSEKSYGLKS